MANILIMDDDMEFALRVRDVLEHIGHVCTWARSGTEALELLQETVFDLLICDIYVYQDGKITVDGGISLIGRVRMFSADRRLSKLNREMPIIAVSGAVKTAGNANILSVAKGVGANLTLKKPIESDILIETVSAALSGAA